MTNDQRSSAVWAAVIAAVVVAAAPAPTHAQDVVLSPVPKEPCCFTNFRFAGTCTEMPRQGQLCQNILSYLNNLNSAGEAYCGSTPIRGGWTLVDCDTGAEGGAVGTMEKETIRTREISTAPVITPSRRGRSVPGPKAVDPSQLEVGEASVLQVRLDRPVDGDTLSAGQQLSGTLEADIVGPDGSVLFPAGAKISTTVGSQRGWSEPSASGVELHMVGATTDAADLFGPTGTAAASGDQAAPSIKLTGELVEMTDGSVVTFEIDDVSGQASDLRVLKTATQVWMDAFNARDAVTIAGLASENGALLPPNGRAVIGRAAIFEYWEELLATSTTKLELDNVETVVQGELGYKAGRFELVDVESGDTVDEGKYVQIWKRAPQGYWELHRDIWNSSLGGAD